MNYPLERVENRKDARERALEASHHMAVEGPAPGRPEGAPAEKPPTPIKPSEDVRRWENEGGGVPDAPTPKS